MCCFFVFVFFFSDYLSEFSDQKFLNFFSGEKIASLVVLGRDQIQRDSSGK